MRFGVSMALAGVFAPVLVLLPAASASVAPTARPVAPVVRNVAVGRPLGSPADVVAALPAQSAAAFSTVGASWSRGTLRVGQSLEVRVRHAGHWSGWTPLEASDAGPDAGTVDDRAGAARGEQVSDPVWVGGSDGVQARVRRLPGSSPLAAQTPAHLRLIMVDPGSSPADADPAGMTVRGSAAGAAAPTPGVYSRAQWGADESLRTYNAGCGTPSYSSTVKVGFVHHTDTPNGYAATDVPSILRGIYAYHVISNGWCDIGYNFLIDRFGRTWEGRYGGIAKPVIGAHTGGFNTDSFAASLIGSYTSTTPDTAMQDAIVKLYAWKLGAYYRNPLGTEQLTAGDFSGSRWPAGSLHTFNVISGHRDADYTTCPGDYAYALLPSLRTRIFSAIGAGLVHPAATSVTAGIRVTAGVLSNQGWALTITDATTGSTVRRYASTASTATGIDVTWDRLTSDLLPAVGTFDLTLSSTAGTSTAVPFRTRVTLAAPPPPGPPAGFVAVKPTRILDTRTGTGGTTGAVATGTTISVPVLGQGGVPAADVSAVVLNVAAINPAAGGYLTVYPDGQSRPNASNLNVRQGVTRANLVTVQVGANGKVAFTNSAGSAQLIADVAGYYTTATRQSAFVAVPPARILDTRAGIGGPALPVGPTATMCVQVTGRGGVPATGVTGVVMNVTDVSPTAAAYVTVFQGGATRPDTSSLNVTAGETLPNLVMVSLGADGKACLYNSAGSANFVADVAGYFTTAPGAGFVSLRATRMLDTRNGTGGFQGPVPAAGTISLQVTGVAGIPSTGVTAVVLNVTGVDPTASGYLSVYPDGQTRPGSSNLNLSTGVTGANLVTVQVDANGKIDLYNSAGTPNLVGDIAGYYVN